MNGPSETVQVIQAPTLPSWGASVIYSITLANGYVVTSPAGFAETPVRQPEKLEFSLERLVQGEQSASSGRVRPVADVLNELRARHSG
jgi:hypothetical protein